LSAANTGAIPAASSYGKEQGYNFPIGKPAVFAYTTALNHLLARNSRQRIQVGDASAVFWAEEEHDLETALPDLFGEPPKDDPNRGTDALKVLYQSIQSGKFTRGDANTRFHVLGLAPNAARIAIRFWETAPAHELARRIARHFDDIKIARAPHDPEHLSLSTLLKASSRRKSDGTYDVPPNLAGEVVRAILEDLPYPAQLLNLVLQRCRAEQAKKNERTGQAVQNVSYARAAIIKACLNQLIRSRARPEKEITMSLDLSNDQPAYRLGRLFAVFERMQEAASERELNKTIRDAYFGTAMSTPRSVFPRLIRLNQHHLRDIKRRRPKSAGYFDGLLREINWCLAPATAFPSVFQLAEQGYFALGYYHQRQAFFTKSENQPTEATEDSK
jgi:CRISPR-associated protein Csd1